MSRTRTSWHRPLHAYGSQQRNQRPRSRKRCQQRRRNGSEQRAYFLSAQFGSERSVRRNRRPVEQRPDDCRFRLRHRQRDLRRREGREQRVHLPPWDDHEPGHRHLGLRPSLDHRNHHARQQRDPLERPLIEQFYANGTTTVSSTAINWNNGNRQSVVLGAATTTISFTNPKLRRIVHALDHAGRHGRENRVMDGNGSRKNPVGIVHRPTLSTGANAMDAVSFQCFVPNTTSTLSCYGTYGTGNWTQ